MKRILFILCMALAVILTLGTLIWTFTLHGTVGLVTIDSFFRLVFIIYGIFGLLVLGMAIWYLVSTAHGKARPSRRLAFSVEVLTSLGIVIPVVVLSYISGFPSLNNEEVPPRLVLTNGSNSNGVPGIAIIQNTLQPEKLTLSYQDSQKQLTLQDEKDYRQHTFLLPDLQPDTGYSFRTSGSVYSFKIPPVDQPDLHFAVASDTHIGAGDNRLDETLKMADQIADPDHNFDYFFSLGDLVESGSSNKQWIEAWKSLDVITSTIPIGFAAGNHDTLFNGLQRYEYYCLPANAEDDLYYRVDSGKVHFLVLDLEWSAECFTTQQAAWLEDQLQSIPDGDWKIVMSHGFYYASGYVYHGRGWYDNPETIQALTPLFEKYKVDLVFSGHNHQMELLQKSGVTYAICGGFGGLLDPEREYTSPASLWYKSGQFGFMDVTIQENSANLIFRGSDYQELKSFTLNNN